jgi:hypothetical protein
MHTAATRQTVAMGTHLSAAAISALMSVGVPSMTPSYSSALLASMSKMQSTNDVAPSLTPNFEMESTMLFDGDL